MKTTNLLKIAATLLVMGSCVQTATAQEAVEVAENKAEITEATKESADSAPAVPDSVRVRELQELIVEGKNAWVENDKIVFVPTKTEKNLAGDIMSLVESMSIPVLSISNGSLTSRDGNNVAIFINGRRASDMEQAAFWAQNALRLEYLEYPSDPRYQGERCVLNIVMKEYVAGGLTGVRAEADTDISTNLRVASKLVYKDMTYIASSYTSYYNNTYHPGSIETTYKNLFYDGTHYDRILESSLSDKYKSESLFQNVDFFASYLPKSKKYYLEHKVHFDYNTSYPHTYGGSLHYTPSILNSNRYSQSFSSDRYIASANGYYFFMTKWMSLLKWDYSFLKRTNNTTYEADAANPIIYNSDELSNTFSITGALGKQLSQKITLNFLAATTHNWNNTDYIGTSQAREKQYYNNNAFQTALFWNVSGRVRFAFYAVLQSNAYKVGHNPTFFNWNPHLSYQGNLTIRDTQSMVWGISYSTPRLSDTQLSEVIVRQTELLSVQGNPNLRPSSKIDPYVNYNWFPSNKFNMGASARLTQTFNGIVTDYVPGGIDYNGIIKRYRDNMDYGNFNASVNATWNIFQGFRLLGGCSYTCYYSEYYDTTSVFTYNATARYTFRNCSWNLAFASPSKSVQQGGSVVSRNKNYNLNFRFTWGTGNLLLEAGVSNILNRYAISEIRTTDDHFESFDVSRYTGRSFKVSLQYTFDYGKKIDPDMKGLF